MDGFYVLIVALLALCGFIAGMGLGNGRMLTGVLGAIGTAAVATPLAASVSRWEDGNRARFMAAEINDPAYARIAERKGRSCAVDAMVAKAMRDGRITNAEYGPIEKLAATERLKSAKSAVAGIDGAACRARSGEA